MRIRQIPSRTYSMRVPSIGEVLVLTVVTFSEEKPHDEIQEEDPHLVVKDPSFSTDCQMRKLASKLPVQKDAAMC